MKFQPQQLGVEDFSGGITENVVGGDPRRSAVLQNFLITVDKKIKVRPGYFNGVEVQSFVPGLYKDARLPSKSPSSNQRVTNLFTVIEETELFGQSGKNLYWLDSQTGWSEVLGPSGNSAIQGGTIYNQTTVAEFQHQTFLVSDGGSAESFGVQPSKIYRDKTGTWVARTAGLPRVYAAPNFNTGTLLAACITLANSLKAAMILHMSDVVPGNTYNASTGGLTSGANDPNFNNLHPYLDKYSLSYLQAESFSVGTDAEIPGTLPTPAPDATDQTSLFTLVQALNNAFSHHVTDASGAWTKTPGVGFYHWSFWYLCPQNSPYAENYDIPRGPNLPPSNSGIPKVLPTDKDNSNALLMCAEMLNDLYQKYNFHRLAVNTHGLNNDPMQIDKYEPSVGKIGADVNGTPTIYLSSPLPLVTPDFGDLYQYVNNLKDAFNQHVNSSQFAGLNGGGGAHKLGDYSTPVSNLGVGQNKSFAYMSSNLCRLPDCTDLDSMYLIIYWLRALYGGLHINDANSISFIRLSMTITSPPTNLATSIVRTDTNTAITLSTLLGSNLFIPGTATLGAAYFGNTSKLCALPENGADPDGGPTSGQAYFRRKFAASGTIAGLIGQYSDSLYHASWNITTQDVNTSSIAQESAASFITTSLWSVGTDTKSWLTLAYEFFNCFASHVAGTGNDTAQSHVWNVAQGVVPVLSFKTYIANMSNTFFVPSVATVSYAYWYTYPYTVEVNGIDYLTQGNPTFAGSADIAVSYNAGYTVPTLVDGYYPAVATPVQRKNVITGLPTLVNDNSTNYDTTNVVMNIARTTDGGKTWYLVTEIANGTTTYTDTTNDTLAVGGGAPLNTNQELYTTGGVVGYDQAPVSKFVHILNGTAYYGAIVDTGQFFPQRIRQSIPFAPDSSPATFFLDLDDVVTGISSARGNPIAFCQNSVSRITGQFSVTGQGAMTFDKISDGIGNLNAKGIVRTEIGVFFAGTDGFYYTDGFQLIKISLELDRTYKALTQTPMQKRNIFGCYDKTNRRIWWNCQENPADSDNSITYIYYLNFGVKPSGVFSTAKNDNTLYRGEFFVEGFDGQGFWRPSSMVFWKGDNIRGDSRGFLFRSSEDLKTDPSVDYNANFAPTIIPYEYRSLALNFGSSAQRKWLTKIHVVGENSGNVGMQINVIRDLNPDGDGIKATAPINYIVNCRWGVPTFKWGDAGFIWNPKGKMDLYRRFPQTSLRADYAQIQMVPADLAVYASSVDYPVGANCTVDNTVKYATLLTPAGYTSVLWPSDCQEGYKIYFETDNYTIGYPIQRLLFGTQIIYDDPDDTSPLVTGSGTKWMIKGLKKAQRPHISAYSITFGYYGDQFEDYPGKYSTSGPGNAGENPP